MQAETNNCQNCKKDFVIEPDDFSFYEKVKVPPPTFCPECRLQRRLAWMKGLALFKRKCDLCGEEKISMYHPDDPYIVYCTQCWWSDKWDARDYAMDYDPNRNFFEQWNELLHKTPIFGLSTDKITTELSPYTNHVGDSKNCYLIYYSYLVEDSSCSYEITHSKNIHDSGTVMDCESCYDCSHVYKSYNIIGAQGNNRECYDCFFIRDCEGCHDCFGLSSAKNKSYVFMGEQLSKEEYENRLKNINLGSRMEYENWKQKVKEYFKTVSPKPAWDTLSKNVSGSYVFHSKNCYECYDVVDCEDSKFLMLIKLPKVKDSYDYTDWGGNSELLYECMTCGDQAQNIKFAHDCGHGINDIEYSKLSMGGSYHFGCVSMKKPQYCILNKQYSKEDYQKLRTKITEDMDNNPYISKQGHIYKYGEFFPPEFSPHVYSDTFASRIFPLNKTEIETNGLKWYEPEKREYVISIQNSDLVDDVKNVSDDILSEVVQCTSCVRGFRITDQELQFLRQHNLPLPNECPFCRVWQKVDMWVQNMTLHDRECSKCGTEFKTHYTKERAPIIYCKDCYLKELV